MRLTVLVVEDDPALREALIDTLALAGYRALPAPDGYVALDILSLSRVALVVSDVHMQGMDGHALLKAIKLRYPELPILLMTAYGTIPSAVQAMRDGAADYLVKPFEAEVLVSKVSQLLPPVPLSQDGLVAVDPRTREVLALVEKVARHDATVMITGESGVGKEVLFRYLHAHSRRCSGPSVAVNCAAIPENMLEAILFGYEKGAFTGAYKACPGKFEQAQAGSILLDEISEMSLPLQAKLLRVLQEREVERLGGQGLIELDVRVVATSNRNLRAEVAQGRFREDLYYRLNVFPLHMPPLRERRLDIVPLAEYMVARAARANGVSVPGIEEEARRRLLDHCWPGNVRELDNVMQRAMIIHTGGAITLADLRFEQTEAPSSIQEGSGNVATALTEGLGDDLRIHERRLILDALEQGKGSRSFAARKLGISPRTLRYKIARMRERGQKIPGR